MTYQADMQQRVASLLPTGGQVGHVLTRTESGAGWAAVTASVPPEYITDVELASELVDYVDQSDPRLTDARTPTAHSHAQGDVTGLTAALAAKADASHTHLWAHITDKPATFAPTIGSTATTAVAGNDARLTNARTPTAHTHLWADLTDKPTTFAPSAHTHAPSEITGTAVITTDPRLSDARTPTSHSITAHSFPGGTTTFLRADGTFATPAGGAGNLGNAIRNASVATQGPGFAVDTYLTGSDLQMPASGMLAKMVFTWTVVASKTAAGAVAPIWQVRIGSTRTTTDASRLSVTGVVQTAAADSGIFTVTATVRSVGTGTAGVLQGAVQLDHNLAATGFANNAAGIAVATGAGFDNSALASQYVGLSVNGGTSAAWTVTQVQAEVIW